jgi:hypothetical protein
MDCHVSNNAGVIRAPRRDELQFLTTFRNKNPAVPINSRISPKNYALSSIMKPGEVVKMTLLTFSDPCRACKKFRLFEAATGAGGEKLVSCFCMFSGGFGHNEITHTRVRVRCVLNLDFFGAKTDFNRDKLSHLFLIGRSDFKS